MECTRRNNKFSSGQPGECIPGQLSITVLQVGNSDNFVVPICVDHDDTAMAYYVPTSRYLRATLPPGRYVFEVSGGFSIDTAKMPYTYYHSLKYNTGTGLWAIIPSAKKEIVNSLHGTQSYQIVHLKSDIITLTETKTIGYFHGIKINDPGDGPASFYNCNMVIFKL